MKTREDTEDWIKQQANPKLWELLNYIYGESAEQQIQSTTNTEQASPSYKFGQKSVDRLNDHLKPELMKVAARAIQLTTQDFTVYETSRSVERQTQMVRQGYSKTMKSKHLIQADGFSHAMDLVPWINGHPVWDWDGCAKIAFAVDRAATELGYADSIRWGGAWDRALSDFGGRPESYMAEVQAYKQRHAGSDFIDGPHFEWIS